MSYKSEIVWSGVVVLVTVVMVAMAITYANTSGKESARTKILEQCQNHQPVTIDGVEIHCGVIHSAVNVEAAKYRKFKQCVKVIKGFTNE
jgi:hypothetical protein